MHPRDRKACKDFLVIFLKSLLILPLFSVFGNFWLGLKVVIILEGFLCLILERILSTRSYYRKQGKDLQATLLKSITSSNIQDLITRIYFGVKERKGHPKSKDNLIFDCIIKDLLYVYPHLHDAINAELSR